MTKKLELSVVEIGGRFRCVYLNNYRIAGRKPYISEEPRDYATTMVDVNDINTALCGTGYKLVKIED